MNKRQLINKFFNVIEGWRYRYAYNDYYKRTGAYIQSHFDQAKDHVTLTKEQEEDVKSFYKRLTGKDVSTMYHEYFYSRTGVYSKEYMPIDLYEADIIGRANRLDMRDAYCDKNMFERLLPHIRHPHTYVNNQNGYFYFEGEPVSKAEAIRRCADIKDCIIKPSLLSKGRGVQKFSATDGITTIEGKSVADIIDEYGKDFIIQDAVRQHEGMSALNPTSVNTLRLMTYRSGMEVFLVYCAVRIGRKGTIIDNQSAGGISAKVNEDGTIAKYAFGVSGDDHILKTDTGIVLEGYKIPSYEKVVETVKRSHFDLPFFDIVGWDVSVGEDGEPVLIEWNAKVGPSQSACGTGLGKYTERIISEVWNRKNTRQFKLK